MQIQLCKVDNSHTCLIFRRITMQQLRFQVPLSSVNEKGDQNFKRKLSKREKKELKKKEKLSRMKSDTNDENRPVAEKLYTG